MNDISYAPYLAYAKSTWPEEDFTQFGRLIAFPYGWDIRIVYVQKVFNKRIEGICLTRHLENPADCERSFLFNRMPDDEIFCITTNECLSKRHFYEKYVSIYHPDRILGHSDYAWMPENAAQIYFTGFPDSERKELIALAEEAGLWVTSGMTQNMDYLVCGPRAGKKKIDKAREMDTVLMNREQFRNFLETGEIQRLF